MAVALALTVLLPQHPPAFERDVLPILQRQGCSSSYCHGSATGRGGLQLSLFGSDPDADWQALAVDLDGRRLDLATPDRSLVLAKPLLQRPHGGGRRLMADDIAHDLLRRWIAAGAPRGADQGPPRSLQLSMHGDRLVVEADFGVDGTREVTMLAVFGSTDERVVRVDAAGVLTRCGPGAATLTARYAGIDATVDLVLPHGSAPGSPEEQGVASLPRSMHPADAAWLAWLRSLGISPGPPAGADRLVRRLYLDLLGRPPSPHEHAAFLAAGDVPGVVGRLLQEAGATDVLAELLAQWFELPPPDGLPPGAQQRVRSARQRLREAVLQGEALDDLAAALLQPAQPILAGIEDPRDRADYVGRVFLGVNIGCARCHDHPHDRWRRRDHLAFAALLASRSDPNGSMSPAGVFDDDGRRVAPAMPGRSAAGFDPGDPYAALRSEAVGPGGAFARNVANRLLGALLGRAPVEPVDDHRPGNPGIARPLLDALVLEYRRTRGDLRALVRWVTTSAVYALDSDPDPAVPELDALRARYLGRREARTLPAPRLAASLAHVLGAPTPPVLPSSPLLRELLLQNGDFAAAAVGRPGNPVDAIADFSPDPATALHELFVLVLARPPRPAEQLAMLSVLTEGPLKGAARQLAVALCCTREFGSLR